MRPRPFSRGYLADQHRELAQHQGFNEATTFQPWIPRSSPTPPSGTSCFNEATTFQPWIRPRHHRRPFPRPPTSMRPRPFSRGYFHPHQVVAVAIFPSMRPRPFSRGYLVFAVGAPQRLVASMRPRPSSRGYATSACGNCKPAASFNKATAFQPWIPSAGT